MEKNNKILFVDDDACVLDAMKRNLRRAFDVHTAISGDEGLREIREHGPFAVVVSDMNMPGMDGATFLARVCEVAPNTVRIMLTGQADLTNAMAAVNEGNIFRFVTKPADPKIMARAMKAAFDQYQLITAEKNLLEETLNACVQVLVDMLSISNPAAFSQSMRVKDYVGQLVDRLGLGERWQYELAALLSQLGAVTVPVETMSRYISGLPLSEHEKKMIEEHPAVGGRLIGSIPRLENVARIVKAQQREAGPVDFSEELDRNDSVSCGAYVLRAAIDLDMLLSQGLNRSQAMMSLQTRQDVYHPRVLAALGRIEIPERKDAVKVVRVPELCNGMVLAEDVKSRNGVLIVTKGQKVTDTLRRCLENNYIQSNIPDTIRVNAG